MTIKKGTIKYMYKEEINVCFALFFIKRSYVIFLVTFYLLKSEIPCQ